MPAAGSSPGRNARIARPAAPEWTAFHKAGEDAEARSRWNRTWRLKRYGITQRKLKLAEIYLAAPPAKLAMNRIA